MNGRIPRMAWATALATLGFLVPAPRAAACEKGLFDGWASSCPTGIGWRYDRGTFTRGGQPPTVVTSGVTYHYEYRTRCENGVNCMAARACDPGGYRYNVNMYVVRPDGTYGPEPDLRDTVCLFPEVTIPVAAVTAAVHEQIRKRLTTPTITSAPAGKTLVNIITIYHTTDQRQQRISITTPVPGSITATPEYQWDFGDGQSATGVGLAYQSPDDPNQLPGKYLGPVWKTPGVKHVTLTITWRVVFSMDGATVPLDPIVLTATEDKTVATARAVLVNH